jgi:hypothetical protein
MHASMQISTASLPGFGLLDLDHNSWLRGASGVSGLREVRRPRDETHLCVRAIGSGAAAASERQDQEVVVGDVGLH